MNQCKALFLDRDGVINLDHAYVSRQEDFQFIDGIFSLCRTAKQLGYLIIIITNQAGIGRGYYTEQDFLDLTEWMKSVFSSKSADIDGVYFSPYHPEHGIGQYKKNTDCRKPKPGMILQAIHEFDIDPNYSILVGDKCSDVEAGLAAGISQNLLFIPPNGKRYKVDAIANKATAIIYSLDEVLKYLNPTKTIIS